MISTLRQVTLNKPRICQQNPDPPPSTIYLLDLQTLYEIYLDSKVEVMKLVECFIQGKQAAWRDILNWVATGRWGAEVIIGVLKVLN